MKCGAPLIDLSQESSSPRHSTDSGELRSTIDFRFEFGNDLVPHVPIPVSAMKKLQNIAQLVPQLAPALTKVTVSDKFAYRSTGALVYGAPGQTGLTVDLTLAAELRLAELRRLRLLVARNQMLDHHRLSNYAKMLAPAP